MGAVNGVGRGLRGALDAAGALFLLQVAVTVSPLPDRAARWLRCESAAVRAEPAVAVVLGGGGIPSGSGLVRTYAAAELARDWPDTLFVVALPADGPPETADVGRMRDELVLRGVPRERIRMETRGRNTREQALELRALLGDEALRQPLCIVSSPLHLRRAWLAFRRAGFTDVWVALARSEGADADLGAGTWWRYGIWSRLQFQVEVFRELAALAVYRIRGHA